MTRPLKSPKKHKLNLYDKKVIYHIYDNDTNKPVFYVNTKFGIVIALFGTVIIGYIFHNFL